MCRIAAKFVPRLLTNDQKRRHVSLYLELREKANEDPTFISRIVTGDESWIYGYDPEKESNRCNGRAHNQPEQKKARQVRSSTKSMLIVLFFDVKGNIHREFVPPNTTVNSDFYCDVLRRLRENVRQQRLDLWCNHNWLLHKDNAPAHTSVKTTKFVTRTEGTMFWNSVWHPKGIASDTRQH
jgi:histone-lysine N-methyltransferase SETMAR